MGRIGIDQQRLARTFTDLVRIDSISREEGRVCRALQSRLEALGGLTFVDGAGAVVGGETGNLIARFKGNRDVEPVLLSAHMDTVEPGRGIDPVFENGVFTSRGETILGADDKCGLAIILEALWCLRENDSPCGPLEVVFSICEEVGLLGAKHLDYGQLTARMGYVLDTRNPEVIITRAPASNRIRVQIDGKAAHAGAEPEKGINAIFLAGQAIAGLKVGRIDAETTCNLGLIHGGVATNIVPPRVVVDGEVRSHDKRKLDAATEGVMASFRKVIEEFGEGFNHSRPCLTVDIEPDFDLLKIEEHHRVVVLAKEAAGRIHHKLYTATSGGGSDANVFARHGIVTAVLGTGCEKVHTIDERVCLDDMVRATRLLIEILQLHAEGGRVC